MSIIKRSRSNFGVVPRDAMEESEMSLKAKGLLAYLLCMPEDWHIYVSQLATVHKESKNTIAKVINELIEFGYVTREQKRDGHRFAGYDYTVFDVSQKDVSQKDVSQKDVSQKLRHVKLSTTKKDNTKKDNTNTDNTKKLKKDFESFWESYHSISGKPKTDKKKAFSFYKKLKTEQERVQALEKISAFVKSCHPEYINKAWTYLKDRLFENEHKPYQSPSPSKAGTPKPRKLSWDVPADDQPQPQQRAMLDDENLF